ASLAPLSAGEEPHWHVTFAVADRDDAVATAERLGATVVSGPDADGWTESAGVRDPPGAVLTLSQFAPKASSSDPADRTARYFRTSSNQLKMRSWRRLWAVGSQCQSAPSSSVKRTRAELGTSSCISSAWPGQNSSWSGEVMSSGHVIFPRMSAS